MRFATIGAESRVRGYELAGVLVLVAEDPEEVRELWRNLPEDVAIVILTQQAVEALGDDALAAVSPLTAVLP
jgi:vacuolar-type H+-ATPase subunit F/Vma7